MNIFCFNYQRVILSASLFLCSALTAKEGPSDDLLLGESAMYAGVHATAGTHTFPHTHRYIFETPPSAISSVAAVVVPTPASAPAPTIAENKPAASIEIPIHIMNDANTLAGTIVATDTPYGLMLTPKLSGLTSDVLPGVHGFHIHEEGTCEQKGMAAGGHLDPNNTKKHLGPFNAAGHLGDLPALYVEADGTISQPVVAPRLKVKDILGFSIMIHGGGDNYSDQPKPLGGGASRMLCGVIPQ